MNGPNTHGELIILPGGGHAFVDGVPDKCEHDYSDSVFQTASGKWIYWHTYRRWAHLPSVTRDRLIQEYHYTGEGKDDRIILYTSQCKKCKKVYEPEMH